MDLGGRRRGERKNVRELKISETNEREPKLTTEFNERSVKDFSVAVSIANPSLIPW